MAGEMHLAIGEALRTHWRLFLIQGVIMVLLGIFALVAPVTATLAVSLYAGWLFLISGIVGLIAVFSSRDMPAFFWALITAALSLIVGILLVWKPTSGAVSLTIVLTAFLIAEGVFQLIGAFAYQPVLRSSWGWMAVSGIADLILAGIIVSGWPGTAAWTLGVIVGVNLLTSGAAIVFTALEGRRAFHALVGGERVRKYGNGTGLSPP